MTSLPNIGAAALVAAAYRFVSAFDSLDVQRDFYRRARDPYRVKPKPSAKKVKARAKAKAGRKAAHVGRSR